MVLEYCRMCSCKSLVVERFVDQERVRLVRLNADAEKARDIDVVEIAEN